MLIGLTIYGNLLYVDPTTNFDGMCASWYINDHLINYNEKLNLNKTKNRNLSFKFMDFNKLDESASMIINILINIIN